MPKVQNNLDIYIYILSNVFSKVITGVAGILLARFLTKDDFGLLKTIMVFLGLIGLLINFGLNDFLLLEVSRKECDKIKRKVVGTFFSLYLIYLPVSLGLYLLIYSKSILILLLFYLKLCCNWFIDTITRIFQAKNRFQSLSVLLIINAFLLFMPVVFLYYFKGNLLLYVIVLLVFTLLSFLTYIYKYNKIESIKKLLFYPVLDKKILKASFPFFVSGLMSYVYMQSDLLMLSFMKGTIEVGRYAVVTTLIFSAYLLPTVFYNYFLPKLTKAFRDEKGISVLYKKFTTFIFVLVLPISAALFIFSEKVLKLLYAYKYLDSQYILKILSVVLFFHSLCFVYGAMLTASGNQGLRSKIQILAAITNILLNMVFIPAYGAEGAAFTTAMTEVIIFSLYWFFSRKLQL
jgi:O-antigen/teichoic acid export membrane protein